MLDIRSEKDIEALTKLLKKSRNTLVLLYADWCPHCHSYLPVWDQLSTLPGRTANMAKVHFDMQEKIPAIANAKIQGYPSVIKVLPDGTIEEFKDESGESTNALPNMRDNEEMKKNLVIEPVSKTNNFKKTVSNRATTANAANAAKAAAKAANAAKEVEAAEAAEAATAETAAANAANAAKAAKAANAANAAKEAKAAKAANDAKAAAEATAAATAAENAAAIKAGAAAAAGPAAPAATNAYPGIVTSKEILKTTKGLTQKGGSLWKELRSLSGYFKK